MPRVVVPHPVLTTARLRLRAYRLEDVDAMHACFSDPAMMRFWDRPAHVRRSQSERAVRRGMAGVPARFRIWAVADAGTDLCVGMVNYHKRDRANRSAHIGYMIHPSRHRQGVAREAVGALIGHCFGELGMHRLTAVIDTENAASCRLAEGFGFVREGVMRQTLFLGGVWRDDAIYGLLRG
jgi:ribosomal-protein-alanine N-acetyltransferase